MAHFKKRRPRSKPGTGYSSKGLAHRLDGRVPYGDRRHWTRSYPRYWDIVYHIRPARAERHALERAVLAGRDPDDMVWPDGRKPHVYYW